MNTTEQMTITLSTDLVQKIHERVAAGEFSDANELIQQSLLGFVLSDGNPLGMSSSEYDEWLLREVVPVYDLMKKDPSRGISLEQVRERLAQEHASFSGDR